MIKKNVLFLIIFGIVFASCFANILAIFPHDPPNKQWNSVPIMPGALAGSDNVANYRFTIKATFGEIRNFYTKSLGKSDWIFIDFVDGRPDMLSFTNAKGSPWLLIEIVTLGDLSIVTLKFIATHSLIFPTKYNQASQLSTFQLSNLQPP